SHRTERSSDLRKLTAALLCPAGDGGAPAPDAAVRFRGREPARLPRILGVAAVLLPRSDISPAAQPAARLLRRRNPSHRRRHQPEVTAAALARNRRRGPPGPDLS